MVAGLEHPPSCSLLCRAPRLLTALLWTARPFAACTPSSLSSPGLVAAVGRQPHRSFATPAHGRYAARALHSRQQQQQQQPARHVRSAAQASQDTKAPTSAAASQRTSSNRYWQTLDYTSLHAAVRQLQQDWVPSKVEQVLQPDGSSVSLRLRGGPDRQAWLHLSWHAVGACVGVGGPPDASRASVYTFGEQLHSHLRGLVLTGAVLPQAWERVAALEFGQRPGDPPTARLVVEIMGRYSNVVLTQPTAAATAQQQQQLNGGGSGGGGGGGGAGDDILLCAYQVGGKMSRLRQLQVGGTYMPPPPQMGLAPTLEEDADSWRENVTNGALQVAQRSGIPSTPQWAAGCVRSYQGASPSLVRQLGLLAGVDSTAHPGQLSSQEWGRLHEQWARWLHRLQEGNFEPGLSSCGTAYSVIGAYPPPPPTLPPPSAAAAAAAVAVGPGPAPQRGLDDGDGVLGLLQRYYETYSGAERYAGLRSQLRHVASSALHKLAKKQGSLSQQLEAGDTHAQTRLKADMLMANAHRHKPGMSSIQVEDWETGETLTLPLDPACGIIDAAEKLYRKARKQQRAAEHVQPLLAACELEEQYLREIDASLELLGGYQGPADMAALRQIQEELVSGGYMRAPPEVAAFAKTSKPGGGGGSGRKKGKRGGAVGGGQAAPREYRSPGGFRVLVGRNNRQNDELTHRISASKDVWMHARGVPGAHVLLCVRDSTRPGDDDLQYAADLAAYFSKARAETRAPVIVADIGDVSRARGGNPGQVVVSKEKVLTGRPDNSAAAAANDAEE